MPRWRSKPSWSATNSSSPRIMLRAGVALQRMQIGTREIRLAISEREADQALAGLRDSMGNAVSYLLAAVQLCGER